MKQVAPNGWRYIPLGDAAQVTMGNSPPGDSYNDVGEGIPLINGPVEFGDGPLGLTMRSKFTTTPTKLCRKGDLLICVRGSTTGRTNVAAFDACIGRGVASIRANEYQRYLNYFICTLRSKILASGKGSTFPSISQEQLSEILIPLPPLAEQKRIADILDKADAIRRKRRDGHWFTEELPLASFRESFREFLASNNRDLLLSDVAEVVSGVAKGRKLHGNDVREVPYLRVANVQAGFLDLAEIKTIPATRSEINELALRVGDVVMTEGGDYDKLGRGALWEHEIEDCIHQNHVFRVRVNDDKMLPTFFVHYLQTEVAKRYFLRCAKKTTNLASINMSQLRGLPVPLPPLKLQIEFDRTVRRLNALCWTHNRSALEANNLFSCLVQRAFRGEL